MMGGETYSTDGPACPYCGKVHEPDDGYFYSEDYTEQECYNCEKTFHVEVYIRHSWTCKKMEDDE